MNLKKMEKNQKNKINKNSFYQFAQEKPYLFWAMFVLSLMVVITGIVLSIEILEYSLDDLFDFQTPPPELQATAYLIGEINSGKILAKENSRLHLFPASLTKLMTAIIVLENSSLDEEVFISAYAVSMEGDEGGLVTGETIKTDDLLKILLLPSSNDAAKAFEEALEKKGKNFIELMNKKAKEIGLYNTAFFDPSGLDREGNFTNTEDLFILSKEIYTKYPYLGEISRLKEAIVYSTDYQVVHQIENTNILAGKIDNLWGSKTGTTPEAKDCLLTIYEFPFPGKDDKIVIAIIILNSTDRFGDTIKLYHWVEEQLLMSH